ncbi:hypothetical protein MKW94_019840 [Papaver nudicaule]|uniref:Uncharacterized protein n=1 Tax=Papaver nudicaule TaxID=74823 RepID=A0AA41V8T3_PAPNU|nr:hypothetical protein [Papaver nudicaule]
MNSRRISVREQNEVKEKIDLMNTKYIPLLDKMLRLGSKNQQLNPGENEFLSKYITVLIKRRSLLERSQGHCWRSMDDLIRWERQLVVLMNCPNLMAAAQLPVDAMSSRGTSIGGQNEINEKFDLMKKKYVPLLDKMLNGLGSTIQRVQTSSSKALRAAVKDIYSVVSMSDVFAGSHPGVEGTKSSFPEDLVSTTRCRVEHGNSDIINDVVQKNFKRQYSIKSSFSGWPLDYDEKKGCKTVNDFGSSEELKSGATSGIKKSRLETNHALLEEVRKINLVLVNSKLDVSGEGTSLMSDAGESVEGTIVKCTFSPMYCSSSTKKFPALPMWFLIPAKYPHCSPVLLDSFIAYQSHDYAYENLLLEAMDKFYASINCISVPISLEDMATSWDSSVNAVFSEYARRMEK